MNDIWSLVALTFIIIDVLLIIGMIFIERKKPQTLFSWVFILTALPYIGFVLYMMFGTGLSYKTRHLIKKRSIKSEEFDKMVDDQILTVQSGENMEINMVAKNNKQLMLLALNQSKSFYSQNNDIKLFFNGPDKFLSLLKDIREATQSINICYYILAPDKTGIQLINLLIEKARQGVEINVLVDALGSRKIRKKLQKRMKESGIRFAKFFPPIFGINLKLNYRNHRKIVVIDSSIAYMGGLNIRDDHMGLKRSISPWHDTHMRITGSSVSALQKIFLNDFLFSYKGKNKIKDDYSKYFQKPKIVGSCGVQVVSSGPDTKEQNIKNIIIKMLTDAKQSVIIQSPYFIPDETMIDTLKMVAETGIKIKIMIPTKIDHKSVYYSSLHYLSLLSHENIEIYRYNGFIHSKVIVVDNELSTVGTCNLDIRSFVLNFEVNAIIYDKKIAAELTNDFIDCMKSSQKARQDWFEKLSPINKFRQSIYRLFSALL